MLYLFAGEPRKGDIRSWLEKESSGRSFHLVEIDVARNTSHNVLHDEFWEDILEQVRSEQFDLILLSPPCNTYSRASFSNSPGSVPLRNADWPEGFPWLTGRLKDKAQAGTELLRRALDLAAVASEVGVPWLLEHPEFLGTTPRGTPASVWTWAYSRKFFEQNAVATVVFHQCAFGAPYAKPTRLAGTWPNLGTLGFRGWPQLDRNGCYRGPLPKSCGHDHPPLLGFLEDGTFATAPTAAYPSGLCRALALLAWQVVDPSRSSVGGSSLRSLDTTENANAGAFLSDVEKAAASLLIPTRGEIVQLFELLPGDPPARGEPGPDSKSFTVGAFSRGGGLAGIRSNTDKFPEFTKMLCRFIDALQPGFEYTAAAIFRNLRTAPHKDTGNLEGSYNLVIGLSCFSGGEVWVASGSGSVACPFEGFSVTGDLLEVASSFSIFNPRDLHCTAKWKGTRVVLVAYTPFLGEALTEDHRRRLAALGFTLPGFVGTDNAPLRNLGTNDDAVGTAEWWRSLPGEEAEHLEVQGGDVGDDTCDDPTSDEDEDGVRKPLYGHGCLGQGPPLRSRLSGRVRWFSDGHGLASPGRWPPPKRPTPASHGCLSLHKEIMDGLLALLSRSLDIKKVVCALATGRMTSSPFASGLIDSGRTLVFDKLRQAGVTAQISVVPDRQPFFLGAIGELLRLAGDPDWRRYTEATWSFAAGVPLGVGVRLPRTPALFERKHKHRAFPGVDEPLPDLPRENYPSAQEHAERVDFQFQKEISCGAMVEMDLAEAQEEFGEALSIASLGALLKPDDSVRVLHDGTHGVHLNDSIKVRDAQSYPTGGDLSVALEELPAAYFSLSGDISRAHRLVKVRRADWARQACRASRHDKVYLNAVGTFGVSSASYWWYRLFSGLGRLLYYCHGVDETTLLSYVDDLLWITQSSDGLARILASILLLEILGVPWAWHKFKGGTEHCWIGFSIFAHKRLLGFSQARCDWAVNWIQRVRADGFVKIADLEAVIGRLSFGFTVLPLLRPFLGPLYAWVSAVRHCHTLRLPKAVAMILAFIEKVLLQGFRTITVPRAKSVPQELFRTDAKAEGSEMWLGGWACSDASTPWGCRWFAEKVQHTDAPWFYQAGQSYRSIAALELLSTLVAVHLFAPLQPTSATFTCSAATDNRGNSFLTSRWLTTSFPLCVVLMDLAAVLQSKSLMLDLHWAPRFQNTLADSLTNQDFKDFDPSKRVRFDVSQYRGLVLRELLESGAELYTELASWKKRKGGILPQKKSKAEKLAATDPWR